MRKTLRLSFRVVDLAPRLSPQTLVCREGQFWGWRRAQEANYYYRDGWLKAHEQQRHNATNLLYTFFEGEVG